MEMSQKIKKSQEDLIQIIARHPQGIAIEELLYLLPIATPKRTLQYRLSRLVKSGVIEVRGLGKRTKYVTRGSLIKPIVEIRAAEVAETISSYSIIPFSQESDEVRRLIAFPMQMRQHVSYRREFLYSYVPNQTFYLSAPILEKLKVLGSSGNAERPAGTYARHIYQRLLIDLSWNSSRLEGNTYSLLETEKLLATGEEVEGKDPRDAQMILNHKAAIEFMVEMAEEVNINRHTIFNLHALLSNNLLLDPKACGRLRTVPVKIGKSVYHPLEVPQLIEENFQTIIEKAGAIKNPFEQSFFLMVHLPYLQPFLDVNKRVSRLAGNIPLIRGNLSPLSFIDVPNTDYIQGLLAIYEWNKIEPFRDLYVWAYERSASLYIATLEAIGLPDLFRMRYRELIREAVSEVVRQKMSKFEAARYIAAFAHEHIPPADCTRFIEVSEVEVSSLHEGNFARFKIRLSEFLAWEQGWK
jgi:Fic family protein